MSVKELKLHPTIGEAIAIIRDRDGFEIYLGEHERSHVWLDRSQAHLLYLYLKEHLNAG